MAQLLFNKMVTLISSTTGKDADGYPTVPVEVKLEHVPAAYKSVYENEFYTANAQGIKTDITVVIVAINYSGETKLIDEQNSHIFKVGRTYEDGMNIELTITDLGVLQ